MINIQLKTNTMRIKPHYGYKKVLKDLMNV